MVKIFTADGGPQEKAEELLCQLANSLEKDEEIVRDMAKVMLDCGLKGMASLLFPNIFDNDSNFQIENNLDIGLGKSNYKSSISSTENDSCSVLESDTTSDEYKSYSDLQVKINNKIFGPKPNENDDHIYRNCSRPRGLVFLANYTFCESSVHSYREGSQKDVNKLAVIFRPMGYVIPAIHQNLSTQETMDELRIFRDDIRHKSCDSCVVIIMSHGTSNMFYTSEGSPINDEDVLEVFSNSGCPALLDKPKLFIFQFCRGDQRDMGVLPGPVQVSRSLVKL